MVLSGGGKILSREPNAESIDARKRPYHGQFGSSLEKCTHYIVYQVRPNLLRPFFGILVTIDHTVADRQ